MNQPSDDVVAYDPTGIVDRWMPVWDELKVYEPVDDGARPRAYVVDMFPYPSGDLHMGHAEAFEHRRRRGPLRPGAGAATSCTRSAGTPSGCPPRTRRWRADMDPRDWTYANIEVQAESFRRFGISVDWRTRLHTSDPDVLPLDPVAVPEALRARAGVSQVGAGQLVPEGPDRARERAGDPGPL